MRRRSAPRRAEAGDATSIQRRQLGREQFVGQKDGVVGQRSGPLHLAAELEQHLTLQVRQVGGAGGQALVAQAPQLGHIGLDGVPPGDPGAVTAADGGPGGLGQLGIVQESRVCGHDGPLLCRTAPGVRIDPPGHRPQGRVERQRLGGRPR